MTKQSTTATAYTPGPWVFSKQKRTFEQDYDGTFKPFLIRDEESRLNFAALLETCHGTEANARLIAAAPELLEELMMSQAVIKAMIEHIPVKKMTAGMSMQISANAKVIAKALGK